MSHDFSVFEFDDYKSFLKKAIKKGWESRKSFTLKWIAAQLEIQYTYLSKTLNEPGKHLHEAHVLKIADLLGLNDSEREFLLILRNEQASQYEHQRAYWRQKREENKNAYELQSARAKVNIDDGEAFQRYLMDPLAMVIYVAMFCPKYLASPICLQRKLNISDCRFKEILRLMHQCGLIELDANDPYKIRRTLNASFHVGTNHPYMRIHQRIMKTAAIDQISRTDEDKKYSITSTFNADPVTFAALKEEFRALLAKAEKIASKSQDTNVCYMSLDLLEWV